MFPWQQLHISLIYLLHGLHRFLLCLISSCILFIKTPKPIKLTANAASKRPHRVYSYALCLHIHSPLTRWLTQSNSQSRKLHHGTCSGKMHYFKKYFMPYFHCTISMFKHTNTVVLQLPTVFSTITCGRGLQPMSNRRYCTAMVCSRLYYLGLCKCILWCLHNDEIISWCIS